MRKFHFALSGLERIRQAEVDRAYAQFADSERARLREAEGIMDLDSTMAANIGIAPRTGQLDGRALADEARYLGSLRARRAVALTRLDQWIGTVERDRTRLTQTRTEHKTVERLRERRYLEFVREVLRDERRDMDEAGAVRHERRLRREAA